MKVFGEPWADCDICGFSSPVSQLQRHYRSRRLVDARCADQPDADYYRTLQTHRSEGAATSPQPVQGQGSAGEATGFGLKPFGEFPFGDEV